MNKQDLEEIVNKTLNDKTLILEVSVLQDNKYTVGNFNIEKEKLINHLENKDYVFEGSNDREFYVKENNSSFTFQVRDFELDETIEF